MDIKKWSKKRQILFWIGLTLIQGTIIATVVLVLAYFSDNKPTFVQMVLLWIIACLGASVLTIWRSEILEKKK